jgi:hypothetical protein
VTLVGAAAKGPFILGTAVSVAPVDAAGNTTGQTFTTQTSDDSGNFSVQFTYTGPVQLSASGYYFNEIEGALSTSILALNGMAGITTSGSQNAYINLLSHIAFGRVKHLMGGGMTLDAAVTQADTELYGQLDVGGTSFVPGAEATQLNLLGGNNPQAAYVFAASSVVEQAAMLSNISGSPDAKVQSFINLLASDFTANGAFTSSDKSNLATGVACVEPDYLMSALQSRFTQIGSPAVVPNVNLALDTDGDNVVNGSDTCVLIPNANQATIPNGICNYQYAQPPQPNVSGGCIGYGTVVADFDGAHGNDIVSIDCTDAFLWLNQGGGSFGSPVALGLLTTLGVTSATVSWIYAADMNGDSKPDLVLQVGPGGGMTGATQIVFLPGDGAGHFGSPIGVYAPGACGAGGNACTVGTQCCSGTCMTLPSHGPDGGIQGICSSGGGFAGYAHAVVTDLNGDGVPDVAGTTNSSGTNAVGVILSGGGTWAAPASVALALPSNTYVSALAAGHVRNATTVDLAVATQVNSGTGSGIYFLSNSGTGTFTPPAAGWTGLGGNVLNLQIGDLDVDGHDDIIGTSYGSTSSLEIAWGDGTLGPAGAPYVVNTTPAATLCGASGGGCGGPCPVPFGFGDATGDGKPDLYPGYSPMIAVNGGNRTFAQPTLLYQEGNTSAAVGSSDGNVNLLVDMNADGIADVVEANSVPTIVLLNQKNHFSW